jgi:hypothetical protein
MIALMVPFRTFSFLDFLANVLQKSISVASNLFACCVLLIIIYCNVILLLLKNYYTLEENRILESILRKPI